MRSEVVEVRTGSTETVVDITSVLAEFVGSEADGLASVFVPHATAGLAIVEVGAGSDPDLLAALGSLLPKDDRWQHRHGHPGHGADHVVPAFISPSVTIPVLAGSLALGTWQSVVMVDTNRDNPVRRIRMSFIPG